MSIPPTLVQDQQSKVCVLHVDDEPEFIDLTATFLEQTEPRIQVESVEAVEDALDRLYAGGIDCILSDYDMPELTGIEFLERVRSRFPHLPFILFTGKGSEEIASEAITSGVTDYLQKAGGSDQYVLLANRILNVVEHERSRQIVERSERSLREIIDILPHHLFVMDEDGILLLVNRALATFHGRMVREIEGTHVSSILSEEEVDRLFNDMEAVLGSGDVMSFSEVPLEDSDGETRIFDPQLMHYHLPGGRDAILATAVEVTDRKERERRLEALNRTAQRLMTAESRQEVAQIGVLAAQSILELEASSIHLYDAEESALVPAATTPGIREIIGDPPVFREEDSIAWRVFKRGQSVAVEDVHEDPDIFNANSPLRAELLVPIGDRGILMAGSTQRKAFDQQDLVLGELLAGNIESALVQLERTRELRLREEELSRQNQRFDEFTAVVSHDLRNPLNVATARLELAQEEFESEHLEAIGRMHERMHALIEDLLVVTHEGGNISTKDPIDISDLARACWDYVATRKATIDISAGGRVMGDPSRVKQLLENLFRNAIEHGGEDVTISVGDLEDGFYVEDDGPGIPDDIKAHVTDPGISTKDTGAGLGLAIVQKVIDDHGWTLVVTESRHGGARFEVSTRN